MGVTRKGDLRTGTPLWLRHRIPSVPRSTLEDFPSAVDVLVIGAGISGALVADLLSEAGLSVAVVDRRGAARGSSAASTALIQSEIDQPLIRLASQVGFVAATRHYRRAKLAVAALIERTTRLGLARPPIRRPSLYLAGDLLDAAGLLRERTAREQAGLEVELVSRVRLRREYGLARSSALLSWGDYAADPVALTTGFLNAAVARGARLFAPEEIVQLREGPRGVVATTRRGAVARARFAVYATGYEIPFAIPRRRHRLQSTWAIATRPQRAALWPTECLIWEASDPYLYLRTTEDGRIVCGGLDEAFQDEARRDRLLERKTRSLERRLATMFPAADSRAEFRWTGTFGSTPTGTPTIGFLPDRRRTLAVLGYGGNGFTFSMIAAQLIRGLVVGDGDPDADLYAFAH